MGAMLDLQKAMFAAIDAALDTPVLDDVPDDTVAPYTRIGETTEVDWDTDDSIGREVTCTIHSWSTFRGFKEVKNMMDAIKVALHEQNLSVFGQKVVMVTMEFAEVMLESDGLTRHGVQRFRILMEGS